MGATFIFQSLLLQVLRLDIETNFQKIFVTLPNQLTTKSIKMEARMLKITKIVRTTTAALNNSLIGRNIRNTYRPEILKQTGQKNYFANSTTRINTNMCNTLNTTSTTNS